MKVPVRWLRELVPTDLPASEIAERLTMAGLEAEAITRIGESWDKVYVGYVEQVAPHPNADRLRLVTVRAGEHRLTVVTGAPNIAEAQRVPLALAGARLIDAHAAEPRLATLKPSTIRGVRSEGMVCSEKELGISDEHEGIMVLDDDAPIGAPLQDYLGDEVIEFEITPNLVHAFSMVGIARELAAVLDERVRLPRAAELSDAPVEPGLVAIEAPDLCPRYTGVVIENVRVEPSPPWMQRRLLAAGVRPISNIVDVTNYVMLEWGQPLHAFDRRFLHEGRIVVRRARPGERMETLDHTDRELGPDTLVIADADRAVAIAGVMGGLDSEIRDDTATILLESANFNMKSVRGTARAQRLRTDASARFERGLDPNLVWSAAWRAVTLIREMIPEARVTAIADVYPDPVGPRELAVPRAEIPRLLGVDFDDALVLDILDRLAFAPRLEQRDGQATLVVQVPTWRSDVNLKADVVEEVARIAGYGSLPETLPVGRAVHVEIDPQRRLVDGVQDVLVAAGLAEIITYPMLNEADLRALSPDGAELPDRYGQFPRPELDLVTAANPLRSDWEMMRPTLLPALLKNVAENLKFNERVAVFETGRVYLPLGANELPDERRTLGIAMAGQATALSPYAAPRPFDYLDLKGAIDALLPRIGAGSAIVEPASHPSLHPGRSATIIYRDRHVGILGELHPEVAGHFGIDPETRVAVAELDLAALVEVGIQPVDYRPVSRFQPIEQDFAVVVDEDTPAHAAETAIIEGAGPLLWDIRLFDIYRGGAIEPGKKSLAYRVTLSAPDRMLGEAEVARVRRRIERLLAERVNATLRA